MNLITRIIDRDAALAGRASPVSSLRRRQSSWRVPVRGNPPLGERTVASRQNGALDLADFIGKTPMKLPTVDADRYGRIGAKLPR